MNDDFFMSQSALYNILRDRLRLHVSMPRYHFELQSRTKKDKNGAAYRYHTKPREKKKKKKKSAIRGIYTVATITKHDCCIDGTKRGIYSFFFVFQCFIVGADRNKDHLNVKDTHIYDMVSSVIVGYLTWSPKQYLAVKASQTRRPTLRAFKTNAPTVLNLRAHKSNIHRLQI